jgi:hypothetical protein
MRRPYTTDPALETGLALSGFSVRALERNPSIIYILDRSFRICFCNLAWDHFANQNGGTDWLRERVTDSSCMDAISPLLRTFYEAAFRWVIRTQKPWEHDYECSSPENSRVFHMRVLPLHGERLLIENSLLVESPHKPGGPPDTARHIAEDGQIAMCGNCRRVLAHDAAGKPIWEWVPAYLVSLPAPVNYGFCDTCLPYYLGIDRITSG